MIKVISEGQAKKIFNTYETNGLFLLIGGNGFVGIDNSTNEAWTEEFKDLRKCLKWLKGYSLDDLEADQ